MPKANSGAKAKKKTKKKASRRPKTRSVPASEIAAHPTRSLRARDYVDAEDQYTLYHSDVEVAGDTYRVFFRVPRKDLATVAQAAVAQHIQGKRKGIVLGVRTEVRELRKDSDQYKEPS